MLFGVFRFAFSPVAATACEGEQVEKKPQVQADDAGAGYPETYYTRTRKEPLLPPSSHAGCAELDVDVCIVGGGLVGISAALSLAERGKTVAVLEQQRVASMASGMNGGMAIPGFAVEGEALIDLVGPARAQRMYAWTMQALAQMKERVARYNIDCDLQQSGMVTLSRFPCAAADAARSAARVNDVLGTQLEVWPQEKVRFLYKSSAYYHATFDPSVCAVHPLNLCLGLARAARSKGVLFWEYTRAESVHQTDVNNSVRGGGDEQMAVQHPDSIPPGPNPGQQQWQRQRRWVVDTCSTRPPEEPALASLNGTSSGAAPGGGGRTVVRADDVILAVGSMVGNEVDREMKHALVPFRTFIMVTEPMGAHTQEAFTPPHCVVDDFWALNYYRPLPEGRVLWGGRVAAAPVAAGELDEVMTHDMLQLFPQLQQHARPSISWQGEITYGLKHMPMIGQRQAGLWHCVGFGGHGLVPTQMAGELLASGIVEKDERWKDFASLFPLQALGPPTWTRILGFTMYLLYGLRDRAALLQAHTHLALDKLPHSAENKK